MMTLLWSVLGGLAFWVAAVLLFSALAHAKAIIDRGELHWFFLYPHYVGGLLFIPMDIIFNLSAGSWIYHERPFEWLFTTRCKRHKRKGPNDWRGLKALWWCAQMDQFDPDHC